MSNFGIRIDDEWEEAGEIGVYILEQYVTKYGDDDNLDIIAPEHFAYVRLKDSGGVPFYYVMRFDAVSIFVNSGETGLVEHKTGSEDKKQGLPLDEQAGTYYAFGQWWLEKNGVLEPGHDLDMILYNFLRKAKPDNREQNEKGEYLNLDGKVSKRQPAPMFERIPVYRDEDDRRRIVTRIKQEAWEIRQVREGKLPIYKNPIAERCYWDCDFFDMCELHETGSDWRGFAEQAFTRSDLYQELGYRQDLAEAIDGNG
jgi:hypothetical protein